MGKREAKDMDMELSFFFFSFKWYVILWGWLALQIVLLQIEIVLKLFKSTISYSSSVSEKKLLCDNKLTGTLLNHLIQLFDEFCALITYNHERLCIHQRNNFLMSVFILLVEFIMLLFCCYLHFHLIQGVHLSNLFPHRMPFRKTFHVLYKCSTFTSLPPPWQ